MLSKAVPFLPWVQFVGLSSGVIGTFVLPWYFPSSHPAESPSYVYGFNNRIAWISIFFTAVFLSGIRIWQRNEAFGARPFALALSDLLTLKVSCGRNLKLRRIAWISAALAVVVVVGWYLILPYSDYGEMWYFVSRLELMILGYSPYSQFDFIYGPLLLYPQLYLYQIGSGLISVEAAYASVLLGHVLLGIWLVYLVIQKLGGKAELSLPFVCLLIPLSICLFVMGLNYTFLRFVGPIASLVWLHSCVPNKSIPVRMAMTFGLTAMNLLISPEIGLAALIAITFYCGFRREYYPLLACLFAFPTILLLAGFDYFAGLVEFEGDAGSFPIYPTVPVIFYLLCLAIVLPQLASYEWSAKGVDKGIAGGCWALILVTIPAALGRCDAGHVFFNGLALFMLVLAGSANLYRRWQRWTTTMGYVGAFGLVSALGFWGHYDEKIMPVLKWRWSLFKKGDDFGSQPGLLRIERPLLIHGKPVPDFGLT